MLGCDNCGGKARRALHYEGMALRFDARQLRGKVPATASWDEYQKKMIGRISLPAGSTGISFRSDGAPRGYLLDLRGIQLVPVR